MTDNTDPPLTPTPLLTAQGLAVCTQFSTDLANLCNTASANGMTPNMLSGQLWNLAMLIGFQVKDDVDASLAAAAPVPVPAPAPVPPPPAPAPAPAPAPPAPVTAPAPAPPVLVPPPPTAGPVTPGPDWVDAQGETYADWQAATAAAQQMAANMGVPYTLGPVPTFYPPSGSN